MRNTLCLTGLGALTAVLLFGCNLIQTPQSGARGPTAEPSAGASTSADGENTAKATGPSVDVKSAAYAQCAQRFAAASPGWAPLQAEVDSAIAASKTAPRYAAVAPLLAAWAKIDQASTTGTRTTPVAFLAGTGRYALAQALLDAAARLHVSACIDDQSRLMPSEGALFSGGYYRFEDPILPLVGNADADLARVCGSGDRGAMAAREADRKAAIEAYNRSAKAIVAAERGWTSLPPGAFQSVSTRGDRDVFKLRAVVATANCQKDGGLKVENGAIRETCGWHFGEAKVTNEILTIDVPHEAPPVALKVGDVLTFEQERDPKSPAGFDGKPLAGGAGRFAGVARKAAVLYGACAIPGARSVRASGLGALLVTAR